MTKTIIVTGGSGQLGQSIRGLVGSEVGCQYLFPSREQLDLTDSASIDAFFEAIYDWHPIINKAKYANNYDYNKAVYLMSEFDILENGFLMLKEDESYASPIATVFYEFYESPEQLKAKLNSDKDHIQCIVSENFTDSEIKFGQTQNPQLWDYADDVDTIAFLLEI